MSGRIIERVGGEAALVYEPTTPRLPDRSTVSRAKTKSTRPREFTYRDTELIEHFVDFTVDLGSGARKTIIDEVEWVQRDIGEVETGGWLIAQQRPRASSKSITIAYATGPLPGSRASRTSVELGDPIEAAVAVREAGIGEPWTVVGDWHAHTFRGSNLPSLQDAKARAGTMDSLGREA